MELLIVLAVVYIIGGLIFMAICGAAKGAEAISDWRLP